MGDIKSALEIAMERAEKLGKLTAEEQHSIELVPKGNALAARFLKGEISLETELNKFNKEQVNFVKDGAFDVFLRNILLPVHEQAKKTSKKSMDGILFLKKEKDKLKAVFGEIDHLFNYYEQALRQLQMKFREKLEGTRQTRGSDAIGGGMGARAEMEKQAALQEEWRAAMGDLTSQYQRALDEHKSKIKKFH